MDEQKKAPSFRKTKSGSWAVMAPVEDLQKALEGDGKIDVLKKSGDWSSYTVVSLGSPFDVDGVKMCYGYDKEQDGDTQNQTVKPAQQATNPAEAPSSLSVIADVPPPDPSEPLPQYQGGAEDEWDGF